MPREFRDRNDTTWVVTQTGRAHDATNNIPYRSLLFKTLKEKPRSVAHTIDTDLDHLTDEQLAVLFDESELLPI